MGARRPTMKPNRTKNRVRREAIRLFKEKGYRGTTLNDICQASALTKSAFYYHYASKDDLLSDYYRDITFINHEDMTRILAMDDAWEQMRLIYDIYLGHILEPGLEILSHFYVLKIQKQRDYFTLDLDLKNLFIPLIDRAQNQGTIKNPASAEDLFETSNALIRGIILDWCIAKGDFDVMARIQGALSLLFEVDSVRSKGDSL
jgi:AcrR family transcriptional regulator